VHRGGEALQRDAHHVTLAGRRRRVQWRAARRKEESRENLLFMYCVPDNINSDTKVPLLSKFSRCEDEGGLLYLMK
jgi:hypothetical protein